MGLMEIAFKIVFIVSVYREKVRVAERCTRSYFVPDSCAGWRLDDLNLTNSIIFHIIATIGMAFLILFAVQLSRYARAVTRARQKRLSGVENMSFSYSMTSVDTVAFHSGRWQPPRSSSEPSSTSSDRHSDLMTQSENITYSPPSQDARVAGQYGTFRRICNRFRRIATQSV